ncbi:MAG: transposase family protein [Desulfamplus sp.]|nr:transposase family protein [Desulfamplus sp.]
MSQKKIAVEQLIALKEALIQHPQFSVERRQEFIKFAKDNGVSESTVRRQYNQWLHIHLKSRKDKNIPRIESSEKLQEWLIMIAAIQLATLNKKGHSCSTRRAIEILEDGIFQEKIKFQLPAGKLTTSTTNRWLNKLKIRDGKSFRHLVPIHFRAEYSNELWQMDVSPSDAKYFGSKMRKDGRKPYLYSVVDDHSGVIYAEYRETRDEDVQAGLEVIYAAMAQKKDKSFPFQGIPDCFYFDPGRIGTSPLVKRVLEEKLGSKVRVHQSDRQTGKLKKASRAKGKVERQFLFLKEDFESLFHIHRPRNVDEANEWLLKYLLTCNCRPHPEPAIEGTRIEIWANDLHNKTFKKVCDPDTFWAYIAEPNFRIVGPDARIIMPNKSVYVLNPDLAGQQVEVWHAADGEGLFVRDTHGKVFGPYPVTLKPILAFQFKSHRKTSLDQIMDKIVETSKEISIPQESIYADRRTDKQKNTIYELHHHPFIGPKPFARPNIQSLRNFYQIFFDWFKQPFGALPENVQNNLESAYKESKDPDLLWQKCQKILSEHQIVG